MSTETSEYTINCFKRYLNEVGKIKVLSKEEELDTIVKAQAGDMAAKKKIIESNLRLVIFIAKRYRDRGVSFEDLISEGNLALLKALKKFEPNKGVKFSTYAVLWLKQAMNMAITKQNNIAHVSSRILNMLPKVLTAQQKLMQTLRRNPTPEEIAKETNLPIQEVREVFVSTQDSVSLNYQLVEGDSETELIDTIPSKTENFNKSFFDQEIREILKSIPGISERDLDIFLKRIGFEDGVSISLERCAELFKISHERVRQIEKLVSFKISKSAEIFEILDYAKDSNIVLLKKISSQRRMMAGSRMLKLLKSLIHNTSYVSVFSLRMGYLDGINHSASEVAKRTLFSVQEVDEICEKVLSSISAYKNRQSFLRLDPKLIDLIEENSSYQKRIKSN